MVELFNNASVFVCEWSINFSSKLRNGSEAVKVFTAVGDTNNDVALETNGSDKGDITMFVEVEKRVSGKKYIRLGSEIYESISLHSEVGNDVISVLKLFKPEMSKLGKDAWDKMLDKLTEPNRSGSSLL